MDDELWTEQIRKEFLQSSKREFLDKWLLPNRRNIWQVVPYMIAVDCAEDLEKKIKDLADSFTKVSRSITIVGIGLWIVRSATWFLLLLEIYKSFFKSPVPSLTDGSER